MTSLKLLYVALALCFMALSLTTGCDSRADEDQRLKVLLDTDANNELDDQHAMAYLFFNSDTFNVVGVTVNATYNGGGINEQYEEAKRVMQLTNVYGKLPLLKGADSSFAAIRPQLQQDDFDGAEAVNFIIEQAHRMDREKLILLPVGKLTNIALALEKDPSIASKVRIVWLGSNYPEPGEYNQDNDTVAMNYILNMEVPFEMVTVGYGKPSGTGAVTANRKEIAQRMPGLGPKVAEPVSGRHGGSFQNFGDYSVNLFDHIETYDEQGTRSLYDMAAVAIVKNPGWAESKEIPAPVLINNQWVERPGNQRSIIVWENFNKEAIMNDFYNRMKHPRLGALSQESMADTKN